MKQTTLQELFKNEGKDFLIQILPEDTVFTDETWNNILTVPDTVEILSKLNDADDLAILASFKIGLYMGARFGMISVTNAITGSIE